jgi:hypothetical protein
MILRDRSSTLEIALRETGPPGTPSAGDFGVNVSVSSGKFSGRADTIWLGRDDWARFVADLVDLERTRSGEAVVSAMSPEEFQLTITSVDRAGHVIAEGWLGRQRRGRIGALRDQVSFSIEIDPSTLPTLVRQLAGLQ